MILESDFYKQAHAEQYPEGITKLISYATARMTRMPKEMCGDKLTVFGIQAYVKDFLIERFNDTFFNVPLEEAMAEYKEIIGETFPIQYVDTGKFEALHKLGYLPVEVGCLAEGTRVPIRSAFELPEGQCQVPFMYIINTHPDFPWITEFLESVTSSEVWYPMAIANQAYYYRQIVNKWYGVTGCDDNARKSAISEFGFRGGKSSDAAIKASSAFLTSFNKTATIPAIKYMHDYYGDPVKEIGGGMISTEHSVMCSNFAVDGDEETFLKKLFSELYPTGAVSVVMDTYDYWANLQRCGISNFFDGADCELSELKEHNVVNFYGLGVMEFVREASKEEEVSSDYEVMTQYDKRFIFKKLSLEEVLKHGGNLKDIILSRPGTVFFRGDSGDPVDIICGEAVGVYKSLVERQCVRGVAEDTIFVEDEQCWYRWESGQWNRYELEPVQSLGTVGILAEMFGCTTNDAGYKVLDSHVRAIYGDSITPNRAEQMYQRLAQKGFAACNVALGAGSFSTQCAETPDGSLLPFTRDSYGIAVKATWCADETKGEERQLFKNPKTDTGKFKKSQKGLIYVTEENGEIVAYDGYTTDTIPKNGNLLQPIFRDGKMLKETTLAEIRNRLHENQF